MSIHPSVMPKKPNKPFEEWPKALFNPETGQERVFASEDEVLPGFAPRKEKPREATTANNPPPKMEDVRGLAKTLGVSRREITADFKDHNIAFDAKASTDELARLWKESGFEVVQEPKKEA